MHTTIFWIIGAGAETYPVLKPDDISLENVDATEYEDGFNVVVTIPERIVGRDFNLYHIHDGNIDELELNTIRRKVDDNDLEVVSGFSFQTENFSEFVLSYLVLLNLKALVTSCPNCDIVVHGMH